MTFELPTLTLNIPEWQDHHFRVLRQAAAKIDQLSKKAGNGSANFQNACYKLSRILREGSRTELLNNMHRPIDGRALTYLLINDETLIEVLDFDKSILDHLLKIRSPLSRLTLVQLIRIFFTHFDRITSSAELGAWCDFLKAQLSNSDKSNVSSDLKNYAKYKHRLFSPQGPSELVEYARSREWDLDTLLNKLSLTGFSSGRYVSLCRYQYYLETLDSIEVGEDHPILEEICKSEVSTAPYDNTKLLGHVCLEILIDRTGSGLISKSWQTAILSIAGDPRVPKSTNSYQQWWTLLGEHRISKVRGWLNRFDLKLFLSVLEQSAHDGGNEAMERMFVPRKAFMEGLLNLGLVTESRLYLSDEAERFLKRNYEAKELPDFARVNSTNTSMIYLKLLDRMHMIEGSHNFKVKFFDKLPQKSNFANYGINRFTDSDLRGNLSSFYYREFGNDDGLIELSHDIHLNWQHKAIQFLNYHDIKVPAGEVIPERLYRLYKGKFENGNSGRYF